MIYDDFANFDRYNAVAPSIWGKVKEFIADALKKGSLEAGRYEISGSQCFVNAAVYDTKTLDSTKLEAHKEYLDIQMTLSGAERIACHDIDGLTVVAPYSQEKDIAFYDMTMDEVTDLVISSSRFAVFLFIVPPLSRLRLSAPGISSASVRLSTEGASSFITGGACFSLTADLSSDFAFTDVFSPTGTVSDGEDGRISKSSCVRRSPLCCTSGKSSADVCVVSTVCLYIFAA